MPPDLPGSERPCGKLVYYLERHIEVDSAQHSVLAEKLLVRFCGEDMTRREDARQAAIGVLRARVAFWDGVLDRVRG